MASGRQPPFRLPPGTRLKLVQIANLAADVIEDVVGAIRGGDATVGRADKPQRRLPTRVPYRPTEPVSDTDRKAAERLLAGQGLVKVKR